MDTITELLSSSSCADHDHMMIPSSSPSSMTLQVNPDQTPFFFENNIDWATLLSPSPADPNPSPVEGMCDEGSEKSTAEIRMKRKKVTSRIAFYTESSEDVLDDGYKWRKYGQKSVKNTSHPRSYYRCTYHTCSVKKQIQRHSRDKGVVITTYEGIHNHPTEKLMETLTPLLNQLQFLSHF